MIDHREIVEEVEAKVGKMVPFVERAVFSPKTKRYVAVSDHWVANPTHYRVDLWDRVLIPKMFAAAARGEMTAEEAVRAAEAQMAPIFDKWREQGKI